MAILGPLRRYLRVIGAYLPSHNFITIHYAYFIATSLISAIIFWGASTPARSVSFVDSLFLCVSAMTLAGLNTINLSTTNTFQQFMLFALIMLGSAIWVSAFVVFVRRRAFDDRFKVVAERRQSKQRRRTFSRSSKHEDGDAEKTTDSVESSVVARPLRRDSTPPARRGGPEMNGISSSAAEHAQRPRDSSDAEDVLVDSPNIGPTQPGITFADDTKSHVTRRKRGSFLNLQGVGARPTASLVSPGVPFAKSTSIALSDAPYLARRTGNIDKFFESTGGWVSRNSGIHGLTAQEREKLGGYEYRAVSLLAWLVPTYFVLWQLLGCLGCAAWVAYNQPDAAYINGLNPWWVGAYQAVSAFNNSGMSLLDANMVAFQTSFYLLITMGLLILAGNTCYPIFLRLIVWCMYKTASNFTAPIWIERTKTLRFLLDHPRRCYTNLFPAQHTWWLLFSVVTLNAIDWAAFEILNINNRLLDDAIPVNIRVIDGLFQAFAVRSGGFYVVTIPNLRISLLVLYVVMMYISVYPVVITMRNSNVYEERSLGIYEDDPEANGREANDENHAFLRRVTTIANHLVSGGAVQRDSNTHFVRQQLRAQLAHDAWWIVLALFLIMIIENQQFVDDPVNFSVFNFIFEIVSAYGCVGISIGVPNDAYSFCGSWSTLSKLILCAVMLRGRHRGLPVAIDKAVLLPGEQNEEAEEDDGRIRMARTMSRGRQEAV